MLNVSISIKGNKEELAKLKKLGSKLMIFDKAMASIGEDLSRYYANEGFVSQGGAYGAVWPRLKAGTSKYKSKHWAGRPPEVRTGNLMNGFRYTATSKSVLIDNKVPYFKYQDLGTTRLPARTMIGVNHPVMGMVKAIIEKDINDKLSSL